MESQRDEYTVAAEEDNSCYYTRYPNGLAMKEAQDLRCPKCGEDRIAVIRENILAVPMMLGDLARCWTCKHEFTITENCWKWRMIS